MSGGGGGSGPGAPLWIVSFSDMIANLVTFFIVLATFNAPNPKDQATKTYAVESAPGVFGASSDAPRPDLVARLGDTSSRFGSRGPEQPSTRREHLMEQILDRFVQSHDYDVKPGVDKLRDGLRLSFQEDGLFSPGSTELRSQGLEILEEIGNFFRGEDCQILVEAHTDDRTFALGPFSSAVDLSRAMATAVARVLVERCHVAAPRVGIMPCGSRQPVAPNDTAAGRSKNRRVVIVAARQP